MREALRAGRRRLGRLYLQGSLHRPEIEEILRLAKGIRIPVEIDAEEGGDQPAAGATRVALEAGPLPEPRLAELIGETSTSRRLVALDGVEDPQNLGAICRVAEASGIGGLILTQRRAPPLSPAASRASAGALEHLPVSRVANLGRALKELKSKGFWVWGADSREGQDLFGVPDRLLEGDLVLVLGGEGQGLRRSILELLDHRIRIPMVGQVESLNVSAAAAVVLFELLRRTRLPS